MKTKKSLFSRLIDFENLLLAYRNARKGSGNSQQAYCFGFFLEKELLNIQEELQNGSYQPAPYRYFSIRDPKARTISVAPFRDRVVHHALVNVLEPIFEPVFIEHSYATRKVKGTHKAILKAQYFMKKYRWFLKTDIDQYFASIDQGILMKLLRRKIKDDAFLKITEKVIRNGGENGKGLPIGNLTSQFFANVYLNPLDHFIKDDLGIKGYVRYMDDFVWWAHSRSEIKIGKRQIEDFLVEKLQLRLKAKNTFLSQRSNGLSFLGTRVFPGTIRIHPKNLKIAIRKMEQKEIDRVNGQLTTEEFIQAMNSSWAHLAYFNTHQLRKTYLGQMTSKALTG